MPTIAKPSAHKKTSEQKTGSSEEKSAAGEDSHAGAQLTRLAAENLIRPLLDETDPAYIFKHTLTQETTYDALLKTKRAELHRQVAEAIEKLSPDQLEQNAAVLALHYERGGWDDLAFVYAALAGDVAWRAFATSEALMHYDRAIEIAKRVDPALFSPRARQVYSNRGRVFEVIGNPTAATENYREMVDYAQRAHDSAMEAQALNHIVTVSSLNVGVLTPENSQILERALELARQSSDQNLIGRTLWNMGLSRRFSETDRATEYFKQALELARAAGLAELAANALTELTVQSEITGKVRSGIEYARESLKEYRALDNKPMITDALANLGELLYMQGDPLASRTAVAEGVSISQAMENTWGAIYNRSVMNFLAEDSGDFERTLRDCEEELVNARKLGFPPFIGLNLQIVCRCYIELNQLELAQQYGVQCAEMISAMGVQIWTALGNGSKAWPLVRRGLFDQAHAILDSYWQEDVGDRVGLFSYQSAQFAISEMALAERRYDFGLKFCTWMLNAFEGEDAFRLAVDMYFMRGVTHRERGDAVAAESDLTRARELAVNCKYNVMLWQIDTALGTTLAARNEVAQARDAFGRAADLVRSIADKISNPVWRESFLQRSDVQRALQGGANG